MTIGYGNHAALTSPVEKYLKCRSYKDKLADFVQTFSDHQQNLRDMLQGQSALKLIDVQVNVRKITTYITTLNEKERVAQEFLEKYGDAEILIKVRIIKKLDLLALSDSMWSRTKKR